MRSSYGICIVLNHDIKRKDSVIINFLIIIQENYHSQQGINLAARIVECLEMARENSAAECYPFEMIEALKEEYWM